VNQVLPPDYIPLSGPPSYTTEWWFGQASYDSMGNLLFDPTKGVLTPFYENVSAVTNCPSLNAPDGFYQYASGTGGYGYNSALGGLKIIYVRSTSTTYLFCDAALMACNPGSPCTIQESDGIVGPIPLTVNQPYGLFQAFTQFRHSNNVANMAFLDGHIESLTLAFAPTDPSWPSDAAACMQRYHLGFPTDTDTPYDPTP
jgi:prepilin-type processing-associated H-X9-DG protein